MKKFWLSLFLLHLILRLAALTTTFLDVDESQFAGFAHVLMNGGLPYRDSLDTKPLGIYLFYQFCFTVFGKFSMMGVHLMTLLWNFAGAVFLYGIFSELKQKSAGKWAAFFFVIFSTTFIPKYIATSINSVMTPLLILSIYLGTRAITRKKLRAEFLSALVLGIAFLFKYQAGIQAALFFFLTLPIFRFQFFSSSTWPKWFLRNAMFGIFFILPFALHSLHLFNIGVWSDFYEWSIKGSSRYISGGAETISFGMSFLTRFLPYIAATLILWIFSILSLRQKNPTSEQATAKHLFLSWLIFSLVPVSIGGRFYSHYFLQLLPALCGLAALGVVRNTASEIAPFNWRRLILTGAFLPALVFWILRFNISAFHHYFPDDGLAEQKSVGAVIKNLSNPEDRIFVWGFATAIYFYAERKPSSRFLWTDWQSGRVPGPTSGRLKGGKSNVIVSPRAWKDLWDDFERRPPAYFIDTAPAQMHGYGDYPVSDYPELSEYLKKHYEKIRTIAGCDVYQRQKDGQNL